LREKLKKYLNSSKRHFITTVNPEILLLAHQEENYKNILNRASLSLADGIGIIFAAHYLGQKIKKRITGCDLLEIIADLAEKEEKSIYFLGGRGKVPQKAAENLKKKFPTLKIAGFDNSIIYSEKLFEKEIITRINKTQPDVLFVALGAPKQEKWIFKNINQLKTVKIAVGIGGALDFLSGKTKRAPLFLRKIGLEWFWRLICQPWRLPRIFNAVVKFTLAVIKEKKKNEA